MKCPICSPIAKLHHGPGKEDYVLTSKDLLFSTKEELYSHLFKEHSPQDVVNTLANIVDFGLLDEDRKDSNSSLLLFVPYCYS